MKIAVTGYPASGKTTVAKALAKHFDLPYINCLTFAQEHGCIDGFDEQRAVEIIDDECLSTHLQTVGDCVIDGHIAHIMPCEKIVLVKCDRTSLLKRMKMRGYSSRKIKENIEAVNFAVIEDELGDTPYITVDTTNGFSIEKLIAELK